MGLEGPFSSKSSAKETTQTGSESAVNVYGKGQVTLPGSISLGGKGAKFIESGATDLSGVKGPVQLGGLNLSGASGTTISTSDPELAKAFAEQTAGVNARLSDLLKEANASRSEELGGLSEALASANKESGSVLAGALDKLGNLLRGEESGGQTDILKPLITFGVIALIFAGAVFYWSRK